MKNPAARKTRKIDIRALILAGGSGTRFWPLGRRNKPKQFLRIAGRASMVEETVLRVRPLIPASRVWTVADDAQTKVLRALLPKIPAGNFLVEPVARNTAPALVLATAALWLENPKCVVVVLPADHVVQDARRFLLKLGAAAEFAAREARIVTFGIPPTFPATGYGYILYDRDQPLRHRGEKFFPVRAFREKPSIELADRYLASGDAAWNSGMFLWTPETFVRTVESCAPDLHAAWKKVLEALTARSRTKLLRALEAAPALSIDYALMEKAGGTVVCEGDFGWSDVGAWSALLDLWPRDGCGNASAGELLALDARDCLVHNPGKLTALVGVRDLIVVDTDDALLVCDSDRDQKVREIVEILRKTGRARYV